MIRALAKVQYGLWQLTIVHVLAEKPFTHTSEKVRVDATMAMLSRKMATLDTER
jgi:hypothetical protein